MWLSNRRTFLCLSGALLAGCTLQPAHNATSESGILYSISLESPRDRKSYYFRNALEDRLAANASDPSYGLTYKLSTSANSSAISASGSALRRQVEGSVTYMLRDLESKEVVYSQNRNAFVSYSTNGSSAATQAAARNAERRLMTQLADLVVRDLTFYGAK